MIPVMTEGYTERTNFKPEICTKLLTFQLPNTSPTPWWYKFSSLKLFQCKRFGV